MFSQYFKFQELKTNYQTEIIGGLSTFMAMAYIIFLNPAILSAAGMDFDAVMMATCLSAALATVIMGSCGALPNSSGARSGSQQLFRVQCCAGNGNQLEYCSGCGFYRRCVFSDPDNPESADGYNQCYSA